MSNPLFAVVAVFALILAYPADAYAYVDPGSGSVIVTTILGLFAAVGYTIRKYYYKIRRFFRKSDKSEDESDAD